jgi:hypothetical protein
MLVKVGDRTYGWGSEIRDLPNNAEAYGAKLLTDDDMLSLSKAIREAGWVPAWKRLPSERVVFLCDPGKWRQAITAFGMDGQFYQVTEVAAVAYGKVTGGYAAPVAAVAEPVTEQAPPPPVVEPIEALPEIEIEL